MAARAQQLRAQGRTVYDFSAGEPDFRPPTAVREAAAEFVRERAIHYTAVAGMPSLREAVAAELSAYHGVPITPSRVLISCGAKHSIINYLLATLDPGDEVVIPTPAWVSYPEMVTLAEGNPVMVATTAAQGWKLQPEALAAVLTPRTKVLMLNSPSNPTGAGYRAEELRALGEVLARHAPQAWVLSDDIYRQLCYAPHQHASTVRALGGISDRVVLVDGVSKTYAMTGWRVGFLVAPEPVITAATRVQGQMTSGPATPSQHAALVALTDASVAAEVNAMCESFARRRDTMLAAIRSIDGVDIVAPDGAFYAWVDVSKLLGGALADDVALASWLLDEHGVATVAGSAFGGPGHLRLSYATDDDSIAAGCTRLCQALATRARGTDP
ncbi:MAG: pyridoxal phosphate-dependent aminotransferase [Deltaproteobacteria bacterium]|nr:pyridoxal phosphate-dependent aminotransferase [Nannocystaceae bacterium]